MPEANERAICYSFLTFDAARKAIAGLDFKLDRYRLTAINYLRSMSGDSHWVLAVTNDDPDANRIAHEAMEKSFGTHQPEYDDFDKFLAIPNSLIALGDAKAVMEGIQAAQYPNCVDCLKPIVNGVPKGHEHVCPACLILRAELREVYAQVTDTEALLLEQGKPSVAEITRQILERIADATRED